MKRFLFLIIPLLILGGCRFGDDSDSSAFHGYWRLDKIYSGSEEEEEVPTMTLTLDKWHNATVAVHSLNEAEFGALFFAQGTFFYDSNDGGFSMNLSWDGYEVTISATVHFLEKERFTMQIDRCRLDDDEIDVTDICLFANYIGCSFEFYKIDNPE